MVKRRRYILIVTFVTFMAMVTLYVWVRQEAQSNQSYSAFENVDEMRMRHLKETLTLPEYHPLPAESNALARALVQVLDAYTSGQPAELRECILKVPTLATNVADSVYLAVARQPLEGAFSDHFLSARQLSHFNEVDKFKRFMELNVGMARFIGDLDVRRGAYSKNLLMLDKCVLKRLTEYRDQFARLEKREFKSIAAKCVNDWCDQIELKDGFTRSYMRRQVLLQQAHGMSNEQAIRFARNFAKGLIKAGYTPKWLDEEFPLPAKQ